jgi:predicted HTH domain antitoxin
LRIAAAVKWYELGRISQAKAAEIAALPRADFIAALHAFGVSPVQLRPGELAEELRQ